MKRSNAAPGARHCATTALFRFARRFPQVDASVIDTTGLDARDARLARAIYHTAVQRWLTIRHLLNAFAKQPVEKTEPMMQAVLAAGAAQLLFMDRIPHHAAIDEAVRFAKRHIRSKAGGLVNAVLRRLGEVIEHTVRGVVWSPDAMHVPFEDGFVPLTQPLLPSPQTLAEHLVAATSHPPALVSRWLALFGPQRTQQHCLHGTKHAPLVVAWPDDVQMPDAMTPHERDGFGVWEGSHDELLTTLARAPGARVQDVTAASTVELLRGQGADVIVDYCAGRGTKTRQLRSMFPEATIVALEPAADRLAALRDAFAEDRQVRTGQPDEAAHLLDGKTADVLVLDVPCSNTGVLARRIEARYRFSPHTLQQLVELQRQIASAARPLLRDGGVMLYATCSIDPDENHAQARWVAEQFDGQIETETAALPAGDGAGYCDGGYAAMLRM